MATGKYLSKQKAAVYLDVCEKTIDRLRTRGELTWIPVEDGVRITVASLEAATLVESGSVRRMPLMTTPTRSHTAAVSSRSTLKTSRPTSSAGIGRRVNPSPSP
jgi:hypothetical protein